MRSLKDYKKGGTCYDCVHLIQNHANTCLCLKKKAYYNSKIHRRIHAVNKRNGGVLIEVKCSDDFEVKNETD